MAIDYLCPICRGQLRIVNSIVISVKTKSHKKGLLFLNQAIGNYEKITHPSFEIKEGDELTAFCPICHTTLDREENPQLVKLVMIDEKKAEVDVFFSVVVGEECTYVVKDKKVQEVGPDAKLYDKYFDIPDQDRKYL